MAEETNQQRRWRIHEMICRCPTCRGTCVKSKLCKVCTSLDQSLDMLQDPPPPVVPLKTHKDEKKKDNKNGFKSNGSNGHGAADGVGV